MGIGKRILLFLFICFCNLPSLVFSDNARTLFDQNNKSIYQILIIENASGKKASIGSGFQVDTNGLIATNFHVISQVVHHPEKYTIEFLDHAAEGGSLELVNFDIIHDLALLKRDRTTMSTSHINLSEKKPGKGDELYSLGNPYDLGMSIVKGTFNGLIEKSFYQKILFTGSLNPGMSGGPTLNHAGEAVGVNVATSGNQISFLVPIQHLTKLIGEGVSVLKSQQYKKKIKEQLLLDQDFKYGRLLDIDWPSQKMGDFTVIGEISDYFNCWGDTQDDEEILYTMTQTVCTSDDSIYIDGSFTTGAIDYQFTLVNTDKLNLIRFHRVYQSYFSHMYARNSANKENATNYECQQDFVAGLDATGKNWKVVFCARQYKQYANLYDVLLLSAQIGNEKAGMISHFALTGVSKENAMAFANKFMDSYQ